ncbi:Spindle pole body protein [Handroanthus impetiginosus]|uniref:Spindle pole body protein n=1 Tax=Handroanthus impetiginosus TaxID=429701 RepID=A0A2G9H005_9LAMI|nr:Spindle pole body protein [Handroanthus impetiginosus]
MLEGLLKSRFFSKCKSNVKLTRTRIEHIKKKRNATEKYLRNDISDLLKNGLDINAYGRAEGLLVELNRSTCYDLIDQYCEHILKHLPDIEKQRDCPEECKEAVSCLTFAAARFADLPELRELRTIFSERYGNSVDFYVNKQFTEKLKSGLPSKDLKLQLLQDIAAESGLEWDSKALENKLFNGSAYNKNFEETEESDTNYSVQKKELMGKGHEFKSKREVDLKKKTDRSSHDEQNETIRNEVPPPVKDIQVDTIRRTTKPSEAASTRDVSKKEENDDKPLKYGSIPPPYTKSVGPRERSDSAAAEEKHDQDDSVRKPKTMPKSVRTRNNLKPPSGGSESDKNKQKAAEGQRVLQFFDNGGHDERDEEETIMDKLLQHYSRKKGSRGKGKLEDSTDSRKHRSRDGPNRVSSLPAELTSPTSQMDTPKKHTRASSFQPELLNANAHVHPKLPDYDEFVARLASLRGNRGD